MIAEHFAAVKAQLEANSQLAGKVYDSARVGTGGLIRDNYVILFGGAPDVLDDERFSAPQRPDSKAEFLYTVRAVGTTTAAVRLLTNAVFAQMVGHSPVVAGRNTDRIRLDGSDSVEEDRNVSPSIFYADADYVLVSRPA